MNTYRDFVAQLAFAAIVTVLVGVFACFSGILRIDGRYSMWNLAAFCGQAYGNPTIKRCVDGSPVLTVPASERKEPRSSL